MTRVWSLSSEEEPQQSQLCFTWKNQLELFSFDSGYESSSNSLSSNNVRDSEPDECNSIQEEDREVEDDETINVSNVRVRSSPIPIPRSRKYKKSLRDRSQNSSPILTNSLGYSSLQSSTSALSSLSSRILNTDLIGHPPCNCGCIRGYRNPYLVRNISLLTDNSSNSGKKMFQIILL